MNPALNPREQQARSDYIERLYRASGRTNGLYTGLYQQRVAELLAIDSTEERIADLVAIDRAELALQYQDHPTP